MSIHICTYTQINMYNFHICKNATYTTFTVSFILNSQYILNIFSCFEIIFKIFYVVSQQPFLQNNQLYISIYNLHVMFIVYIFIHIYLSVPLLLYIQVVEKFNNVTPNNLEHISLAMSHFLRRITKSSISRSTHCHLTGDVMQEIDRFPHIELFIYSWEIPYLIWCLILSLQH